MRTWLGLVLVVGLAAACAKTDSEIRDVPGATETNVARGMCSSNADCPDDDAGEEARCETAEDCAEGERCSARGSCYEPNGS